MEGKCGKDWELRASKDWELRASKTLGPQSYIHKGLTPANNLRGPGRGSLLSLRCSQLELTS